MPTKTSFLLILLLTLLSQHINPCSCRTLTKQNQKQKPKPLSPIYCGQSIYRSRKYIPLKSVETRWRQVETLYGFNMFVDTFDMHISFTIAAFGTWESENINIIGRIVKEGDHVINLGSQTGLEVLVIGKIIGENGKIFIFQPYSVSNAIVNKNFQMNGMKDRVTIYKMGASDRSGKSMIKIQYSNTGGSQIQTSPDKIQKMSIQQLKQIYDEVEQVQLNRPDVIIPQNVKFNFALVDVELMQLKALIGLKDIIKRSPGMVVMSQWHYSQNPRPNPQEALDFLNFMIGLGYTIYKHKGGNAFKCQIGQFTPFAKPEDLLGPIGTEDIFFFPQGYKVPQLK